MPKGTRQSSAVYPSLFSHQPGKSEDEMSYTHLKGGKGKSVKGKNLRNIVGDEKAAALKAATAAKPKSRAGEKGVKTEYSFGDVRNPNRAARAAKASKAKATVDKTSDEIVKMVKDAAAKGRATSRSSYE